MVSSGPVFAMQVLCPSCDPSATGLSDVREMMLIIIMIMMQYIYSPSFTKVPDALHSSTIKGSHRQKTFSAALYKGKAIQLFEHKRKPMDDGGT